MTTTYEFDIEIEIPGPHKPNPRSPYQDLNAPVTQHASGEVDLADEFDPASSTDVAAVAKGLVSDISGPKYAGRTATVRKFTLTPKEQK